MSARRLCHVFATFDPGGPQVRTAQWIRAFGERYEHRILAMDGRTGCYARLADLPNVALLARPQEARGLLAYRSLRRLLESQQPDLILSYNWGAMDAVLANRKERIAPHRHHEDGFGPDEFMRRKLRRSLARRFLLRGIRVLVPSRVLERICMEEWRLAASQVRFVPNGIDVERFRAGDRSVALQSFGLSEDARWIVSLGHLRPEKAHARLLEAFAGAALGEGWALALAGDGPLRDELAERARVLGIAERVRFLGSVEEPESLLRAASVFALPSDTEQMPVALLEAMATGLPCIATDVGDVREILPAAACAQVVPPGRADLFGSALVDMVRAMDETAARPLREEPFAAACRERVVESYSEQRMLDAYKDWVESAFRG